ncbi:MAG: hypothetical protein ACP5U1_13410 [Desulfomonilaceae bacterium]
MSVTLIIWFCVISLLPMTWAEDHEELQTIINAYFEAKKSKNYDMIWNLLAPSSVIKRFYTYEGYLAMMNSDPVRLVSYEIQFNPAISDNQDRKNLPNVEKIASVVVKERLEKESGQIVDRIDVIIFVLENSRWYKS